MDVARIAPDDSPAPRASTRHSTSSAVCRICTCVRWIRQDRTVKSICRASATRCSQEATCWRASVVQRKPITAPFRECKTCSSVARAPAHTTQQRTTRWLIRPVYSSSPVLFQRKVCPVGSVKCKLSSLRFSPRRLNCIVVSLWPIAEQMCLAARSRCKRCRGLNVTRLVMRT